MHRKGKGAQRSACKGQRRTIVRADDIVIMQHPRADRGTEVPRGVSKVDRSHRITCGGGRLQRQSQR